MKPFVIMLKYACRGIKASEVSSRASQWGRCRLRAAGGCTPTKMIPRGCLQGWLPAWLGLTDLLLQLCESQSGFDCLLLQYWLFRVPCFFWKRCLLTLSPNQCQTSLLSYVWSLKYYPTFQALAFHILIFCLLSSYLWHEHYIQGHGRRSICINSS